MSGVRISDGSPRRSKRHIACSDFFLQKSERAHFAAPPFQTGPAALGSGLGSGADLEACPQNCSHVPKRRTAFWAVLLFGLRRPKAASTRLIKMLGDGEAVHFPAGAGPLLRLFAPLYRWPAEESLNLNVTEVLNKFRSVLKIKNRLLCKYTRKQA